MTFEKRKPAYQPAWHGGFGWARKSLKWGEGRETARRCRWLARVFAASTLTLGTLSSAPGKTAMLRRLRYGEKNICRHCASLAFIIENFSQWWKREGHACWLLYIKFDFHTSIIKDTGSKHEEKNTLNIELIN